MDLPNCEVSSIKISDPTDIANVYPFVFIPTNFPVDFLFSNALPPLASNLELKKILKLLAKIICLFWLIFNFFNCVWSSSKNFTCLVSVLALYRFFRIYWSTSSVISNTKNENFLGFTCFLLIEVKRWFMKISNQNANELDAPWKNSISQLNSLTYPYSLLILECVFCKKKSITVKFILKILDKP